MEDTSVGCHFFSDLRLDFSKQLQDFDKKALSNALEECTFRDWFFLGRIGFNLSPAKVENIKDATGRSNRIVKLVDTWIEVSQGEATLLKVCSILSKEKLIGIKEIFLKNYASEQRQAEFNEKYEAWDRLCKKLVVCRELENAEMWESIKLKLELTFVTSEECSVKLSSQRLNYLNICFEKLGIEACMNKIKEALTSLKLRRVIYCVETDKRISLCPKFVHIIEHEWDNIIHNSDSERQGQLDRIFQQFNQTAQTDKDAAFYRILEGNEFFHTFMELLSKEVQDGFCNIFTEETRSWLSTLQSSAFLPKDTDFYEAEICRLVESLIFEKRFVMQLGCHGMGKSQTTAMLMEKFNNKYPFSLIQTFDLKNEQSAQNSLINFKDTLHKSEICFNKIVAPKKICEAIKSSHLYVLFIFENYNSDSYGMPHLMEILKELKCCGRAYVVVNAQDGTGLSGDLFHVIDHVFSEADAASFLMQGESFDADEEEHAIQVARRHGCLPLHLAMAKACCVKKCRNSYSNYLDYLDDEELSIELKNFEEDWKKRWYASQKIAEANEIKESGEEGSGWIMQRFQKLEDKNKALQSEVNNLKRRIDADPQQQTIPKKRNA